MIYHIPISYVFYFRFRLVFLKTSWSIQYFVGILIQSLNKLNKNSENDYSNQLFGMVFNIFFSSNMRTIYQQKKEEKNRFYRNLHILNKCINLISYLYWRLWVNAINSISNEEIDTWDKDKNTEKNQSIQHFIFYRSVALGAILAYWNSRFMFLLYNENI